nr:MAG TPA: hypothetical protein [Caudoviricetes sp.]
MFGPIVSGTYGGAISADAGFRNYLLRFHCTR